MKVRGISSPCKDCPNRFVGCHSTCVKYIDYQQAQIIKNAEIRRKKAEVKGSEYTEYIIDRHLERKRKKHRGTI